MIETSIIINYEGKDITGDISPYLLSFTYNDNSGGQSDDLNINLQDKNFIWLEHWTPSKGDIIRASIQSNNNLLPCGIFSVDQIEFSSPPKILSIKAISAPVKNNLTCEKKNRAWENVKLSRISQDIAANGNMELYFDVDNDYFIERREQANQSDLDFLRKLCADYNLSVKINDGKIIVYDLAKIEREKEKAEINSHDKKIISWKFTSKSTGIFSGAKVLYHNARKGQTFEAKAKDDSVENSGKILVIHDRIENEAHAQELAKKSLREANQKEITGNIILAGDNRFSAGINILCSDFGLFSGKYFIERVTHNISRSGYTTELNIRMGSEAKKKAKSAKNKKQSGKGVKEIYYKGSEYYRAE